MDYKLEAKLKLMYGELYCIDLGNQYYLLTEENKIVSNNRIIDFGNTMTLVNIIKEDINNPDFALKYMRIADVKVKAEEKLSKPFLLFHTVPKTLELYGNFSERSYVFSVIQEKFIEIDGIVTRYFGNGLWVINKRIGKSNKTMLFDELTLNECDWFDEKSYELLKVSHYDNEGILSIRYKLPNVRNINALYDTKNRGLIIYNKIVDGQGKNKVMLISKKMDNRSELLYSIKDDKSNRIYLKIKQIEDKNLFIGTIFNLEEHDDMISSKLIDNKGNELIEEDYQNISYLCNNTFMLSNGFRVKIYNTEQKSITDWVMTVSTSFYEDMQLAVIREFEETNIVVFKDGKIIFDKADNISKYYDVEDKDGLNIIVRHMDKEITLNKMQLNIVY